MVYSADKHRENNKYFANKTLAEFCVSEQMTYLMIKVSKPLCKNKVENVYETGAIDCENKLKYDRSKGDMAMNLFSRKETS